MEGPIFAVMQNVFQHGVQIAQHIACSNPHCLKSKIGECRVSPDVTSGLMAATMSFTVYLNGETALQTGEVENVTLDWKLPSEA